MNVVRASLLALLTVLSGGVVDCATAGVAGADYTIWADNFGKTWATFGEGDANGDRIVTGADYTVWADDFGQSSIDYGDASVATYGYGYEATSGAGRVWGDYKEVNSAPNLDPYYVPPGRASESWADAYGADFVLWPENFGSSGYTGSTVPEPSSVVLGALALAGTLVVGLRRRVAR